MMIPISTNLDEISQILNRLGQLNSKIQLLPYITIQGLIYPYIGYYSTVTDWGAVSNPELRRWGLDPQPHTRNFAGFGV